MGEDRELSARDRQRADKEAAETKPVEGKPSEQAILPGMDFTTFILSLATSVQISLGAIPHAEGNSTGTNIPAAKQMIDAIAMLQEKTQGNLSKEEETLVEHVLFSLRMHYARIAGGEKGTGGS